MEINYEVLDKLLLDLSQTDDGQISSQCIKEIPEFIQTHDVSVFSDYSLSELSSIFRVSLNGTYTAITGQYMPNIFVKKEFDA